MAQKAFQAEVSKLFHLIIHSLYSTRRFSRELVSNSSDAIDKLKYLTVSDDAYKAIAFDPRIRISFDKDAKTLTIEDNGIGMDEKDCTKTWGLSPVRERAVSWRPSPRTRARAPT
jgi:molecular chaperone HtpG